MFSITFSHFLIFQAYIYIIKKKNFSLKKNLIILKFEPKIFGALKNFKLV